MRLRTIFGLLLMLAAMNASADETSETEAGWSVTEPPGEWQTISIDTREVTWSDVDISPDGQYLLFHMLGDVYRVGIEGG